MPPPQNYGTTLYLNSISTTSDKMTAKDVSVNDNLYVQRDTSLNGQLYVVGQSTLADKLITQKDISANANLYVQKDTSLNGQLYVVGQSTLAERLITQKDISANANLYVQKDTSLNGQLYVVGQSTLAERLITQKDISANANLYVQLDTSLNGELYVVGQSTLADKLIAQKDISANANLYVQLDTSLNGKLSVFDESTFKKKVSIEHMLDVSGNVLTKSNLYVSGDISTNGKLYVDETSDFTGHMKITTMEASTSIKVPTINDVSTINAVNNSTLNIGTNASDIHIGGANTNVYIDGSVNYIVTDELRVTDKLITLNRNGVTTGGSGIEIEKNDASNNHNIEAYLKLSPDSSKWMLQTKDISDDEIITKRITDRMDISMALIANKVILPTLVSLSSAVISTTSDEPIPMRKDISNSPLNLDNGVDGWYYNNKDSSNNKLNTIDWKIINSLPLQTQYISEIFMTVKILDTGSLPHIKIQCESGNSNFVRYDVSTGTPITSPGDYLFRIPLRSSTSSALGFTTRDLVKTNNHSLINANEIQYISIGTDSTNSNVKFIVHNFGIITTNHTLYPNKTLLFSNACVLANYNLRQLSYLYEEFYKFKLQTHFS